ncbi:hypothetical protein THAOC_11271, partial [Thalassiosira oceanica]
GAPEPAPPAGGGPAPPVRAVARLVRRPGPPHAALDAEPDAERRRLVGPQRRRRALHHRRPPGQEQLEPEVGRRRRPQPRVGGGGRRRDTRGGEQVERGDDDDERGGGTVGSAGALQQGRRRGRFEEGGRGKDGWRLGACAENGAMDSKVDSRVSLKWVVDNFFPPRIVKIK